MPVGPGPVPFTGATAFALLEILESSELFSYLFGFWLFLFSSRFRAHVRKTWRRRRGRRRLLIPLEILIALCCGLAPLLALLALLR